MTSIGQHCCKIPISHLQCTQSVVIARDFKNFIICRYLAMWCTRASIDKTHYTSINILAIYRNSRAYAQYSNSQQQITQESRVVPRNVFLSIHYRERSKSIVRRIYANVCLYGSSKQQWISNISAEVRRTVFSGVYI